MNKPRPIQLTGLMLLWLLASICHAGTISGKVVSVADGDTITVLDADKQQHKIRLEGIDAPEKAQPYGKDSKKALSDLVFGKDVQVLWLKSDPTETTLGGATQ